MLSPNSNKNNPDFIHYYQTLADIIGIFWQFHKERVQTGNLEFAYIGYSDYEEYKHVPFNPQLKINSWHASNNYNTHRVIADFGQEVASTLDASWQQFLKGMGVQHIKNFLDDAPIPESTQRFMDPYVRSLIKTAEELGKDLSKVSLRDGYTLEAIVGAGIRTGSEVTTHLNALFGKEFKPVMAVIISKVRLDDIIEARKEIGITTNIFGQQEGEANYDLLDNSPHGLDRDRLKELGLGDTLGCPASMKVSERTRQFLSQRGIDVSRITMLEDFAQMTAEKFDHYVGEWYRGLIPQQKESFVETETRKVIDGTARKNAQEGRDQGQCPYSHGKERMG